MANSEYRYTFDRPPNLTGDLVVKLTAQGQTGVLTASGRSPVALDDGVIPAGQKNLKKKNGASYVAYTGPGKVAGTDPAGGVIVLTVLGGRGVLARETFEPVETAPGVVDIDQLIRSGKTLTATPEQLQSLSAMLATGQQQQTDWSTVQKPAIQQALADITQRQDANDAAQAQNNVVVQKIGAPTDIVELVGNTGSLLGWQSDGGALTGFAGPIGTPNAFNRVTVKVKPWDNAKPITQMRVVVRATNSAGAILTEATVTGLSLTIGAISDVAVDLPATVGDGVQKLWLEYWTDGKTGLANIGGAIFPTTSGYPLIKYTTQATLTPSSTPDGANTSGIWAEFRKVTPDAVLTIADSFTTALEAKLPGVTTAPSTVTAMATSAPALTSVQISGPALTMDNNYSTFSGWGSPVGTKSAFNYLAFYVNPWDTANPITQIRVRVRENDYSGAILADVLQDVSLTAGGGQQLVEVYLPATVNSAQPLWVEYLANGRTGRLTTATVYNTPMGRYTTSKSVNDATLPSAVSTQINLYFKFGITTDEKDVRPTPSLRNAVDPHWQATLTVPSNLWGVVGREMNVYYDNILHSPFPRSHFWTNVQNSLNRGKEQEERWTVTPTVAETSTTTFELSYGAQKIATKTATVKVAAASAGANVTRKWLPIGDSTTNASIYPKEVLTLFNADTAPMRIQIVGTNPGTAGGYTDVKTEGWSGKTTAWLYSDPASPFTFGAPNTFDFAQYLSSTSQTMSSGDWATIHIGINDVFQLTDDDGVRARAQEMVTQLNAMISNMQAAVPGLRVAVLECIPPSASQDAFGESYGTNYNRARYRRNRDVMLPLIQQAFEGRTGSGVFYAAFGCALDTVNNMYRSPAAPVNSRSTVQVQRQGNGVHPDIPGYYQMADAVYAFFKCQEA